MPLLDSDGRFKLIEDWSNRIDGAVDGVLTKTIDPAEHRTALILHDVEHVSKPQVAAILGIDVPDVRRRVHFARLFVRKRLSAHFRSAAAASSAPAERWRFRLCARQITRSINCAPTSRVLCADDDVVVTFSQR